jgi:peptide deformylase
MAFRETLQIGHPALKAQNSEITDFSSEELKRVVQDLTDTMRQNQLIGMAGPQIGENFKVFVTEPRETPFRPADQTDELRVYVNPKIIFYSPEESIIYEGCGSVLNGSLFGPVKRPKEIIIEAFDQNGKRFQFKCDGILARVIQHEYDHLDGIEFTEKIYNYKLLLSADFYKERIKMSDEQVKNSEIRIKEFKYL